jgi:hypothetical protein
MWPTTICKALPLSRHPRRCRGSPTVVAVFVAYLVSGGQRAHSANTWGVDWHGKTYRITVVIVSLIIIVIVALPFSSSHRTLFGCGVSIGLW